MSKVLQSILKAAAILLGSFLAVGPAMAQVESVLSASQPYYTVMDMRDDSVAAAVRFLPGKGTLNARQTSERDGKELHAEYLVSGENGVLSLGSGWEGRTGMQAEFLPGTGFLAGGRATAFANPGEDMRHYASANVYQANDFELAPHTMLSVSVDFLARLHAAAREGAWDSGSVQASMYLGFYHAGADTYDDEYLGDWAGPFRPGIAWDESRSVVVVNDSDEWALGRFELALEAWVQVVPAPVPELPPWAMHAAGLLGCALAARCRRKKRGAEAPLLMNQA